MYRLLPDYSKTRYKLLENYRYKLILNFTKTSEKKLKLLSVYYKVN